jgi:predicted nucleic acid-binding protein
MPDAHLLDTSIASIAWDGGHPQHTFVRQKLAALDQDSISICSISLGEKEYGLQVSPGIDQERSESVRQAMRQYNVWNIGRYTADYYGQIRGELFKRYGSRDKRERLKEKWPESLLDRTTARELGIQENDLWIVSVAVEYDLHFITQDRKIQRILDVAKDLFSYDRADIWSLPSTSPDMPFSETPS